MKYLIFALFTAFVLSYCNQQESSAPAETNDATSQYIEYIQDPANGYIKKLRNRDYQIVVIYTPPLYRALSRLEDSRRIDILDLEISQYLDHYAFEVIISNSGIKSKPTPKVELVNTINDQVLNQTYLINESLMSLSPYQKFLVEFKNTGDVLTKASISIEFNGHTHNFTYDNIHLLTNFNSVQ